MNIKTQYKTDLDSLKKAYKLNDLEVLTSVKDQIYSEHDLSVADNIDMQAQFEVDEEKSLFLQAI